MSEEGWSVVFSSPAFNATGWSRLDYILFTVMSFVLASQTVLLTVVVGSRVTQISQTCQLLAAIDGKLAVFLPDKRRAKLLGERSSHKM